MSTFNHGGCSLLKATALAAALLLGFSALAENAPPAPSGTVKHKHATKPPRLTCLPYDQGRLFDTAVTSNDRYTLLLFFKPKTDLVDVFNLTGTDGPGCILDPDGTNKGGTGQIIVQGSCPTDCGHSQVEGLKAFTALTHHPLGDPLQGAPIKFGTYNHPQPDTPGWGIFFADPKGALDRVDPDSGTAFEVWQILAKDSCHAGIILSWLITHYPDVFSARGGYLGQIMIGSSTKDHWGTGSTDNCRSIDPTP